MKQIGRLHRAVLCRADEGGYLGAVQTEAPCQRTFDDAFLAILDAVVAAGDFDEEHGKSESGVSAFGRSARFVNPGQKAVQCVEHVAPRWLSIMVPVCKLVTAGQ